MKLDVKLVIYVVIKSHKTSVSKTWIVPVHCHKYEPSIVFAHNRNTLKHSDKQWKHRRIAAKGGILSGYALSAKPNKKSGTEKHHFIVILTGIPFIYKVEISIPIVSICVGFSIQIEGVTLVITITKQINHSTKYLFLNY